MIIPFNNKNFILMTDAYKHSHWKFLPSDLNYQYAYIESRGVYDKGVTPETLFFGLQHYLKNLYQVKITKENVQEAAAFVEKRFGRKDVFNYDGWMYIVNELNGRIPVKIKAVPEGTVIPSKNVLVTIENTDPRVPWIVNHIETSLLRAVWYPTTVATTSFAIKKLIRKWAQKTGGTENVFWLNDFGARGVSSGESAEIGGAAHLVNFFGTDTDEGVLHAMDYYDADVCGFTVPASEHSVTIVHGEENEIEAYRYFLERYPSGIISIVSDSYDLYNAVDNIFGKSLKEKITERNGKVVIRPDSGHPPTVCVRILKSLYKNFGGIVNDFGYKVLNEKVGVIYGDYISYGMIDDILAAMEEAGFSTDNIIFGMGGALLQQVHRDTYKFAMKVSYAEFTNGESVNVKKHPTLDSGKNSKAGKLMLIKEDGLFKTISFNEFKLDQNCLETVYERSKESSLLRTYTFDDIRNLSNTYL